MRKISYRFVYNRKKNLSESGTALVQVEAYLNRKKVYFSTHVYLRPEQWDDRRKRVCNHPNEEALNIMLNEYLISLERKELELWKQGKIITLALLKESPEPVARTSFLSFARKEVADSQAKESTKRNHLTTIALLQSFRPSIDFKDLTYTFVTDFEKFLHDASYQVNTIAKHMKHLKIFVNAAIDKGFVAPEDYPFRRYKIKMKEGRHVFLLPEEVERLEKLSAEGCEESLQHTLDAFLFCCYTGLRYSDFVNMRSGNIVKMDDDTWLVFESVKTGTETRLPLHLLFGGKAVRLLRKYHRRWDWFFQLRANSSVNKDLQRIGRAAHIGKHFSFHSARHTNATLLIYMGVNITTVQKLLGHKSLSTTQIYGEVMESTIIRDLKKCHKK